MAIRQDEGDAFIAFRKSLQAAMKERLASEGSRDAAQLARTIEDEVIEPALSEVRRRLGSVERTLGRRRATAVGGLGGLATVCGLLGHPQLVVPLVTAAGVAEITAEAKAAEERQAVELSDMWFLWKADLHVEKTASKNSGRGKKPGQRGRHP